MTTSTTFKQYLDWFASVGDPIAGLSLKFGRRWKAAELPFDVKLGRQHQCFQESRALVLAQPKRFTYVEGYAFKRLLPLHHAWCVDEHGNVVDPTWSDIESAVYCGTAFRHNAVYEGTRAKNDWGFLGTPRFSEKIIASPERFLMPLDSHKWGAPTLSLDVALDGVTLSPL